MPQPDILRVMNIIKKEEAEPPKALDDEEMGEGRSDSESSEDDVNDD